MKIFICEHACSALPTGAAAVASAGFRTDLLLQSLLADVSRVADLDVSILRDPRSGRIDLPGNTSVVPLHGNATLRAIDGCIRDADAVWPLAPESHGMLESISKKVLQHNKILLGSTPDAVHLTGSKYRTSQALRAAGIPVVPTWRAQVNLPADQHAWVVKPDDGAGCADTHIFSNQLAAREWIAARATGDYVLQPYISGRPCSLSLLCGEEEMFLLGCNDQHVAVSDNQFHYMGSTVNSIDDGDGELRQLAWRVIAAIPGLWGYVGIDLIITDQGPVVLEVNPRMTMSHAGLHASIGANPAAMLFAMLRGGGSAGTDGNMRLVGKCRQVSVDVNDSHQRSQSSCLPAH